MKVASTTPCSCPVTRKATCCPPRAVVGDQAVLVLVFVVGEPRPSLVCDDLAPPRVLAVRVGEVDRDPVRRIADVQPVFIGTHVHRIPQPRPPRVDGEIALHPVLVSNAPIVIHPPQLVGEVVHQDQGKNTVTVGLRMTAGVGMPDVRAVGVVSVPRLVEVELDVSPELRGQGEVEERRREDGDVVEERQPELERLLVVPEEVPSGYFGV
mmetsp:Transcript_2656/g.5889  ORF Transcript_2656/g.5889 Transcript_2656/m.5889 type:complete len:210 (+) Transcript_2656:284-913(+)